MIRLVMTCRSHPEAYDVYTSKAMCVGWIQLRWGRVIAHHVDIGHIYVSDLDNHVTGTFPDEDERRKYLTGACQAFLDRLGLLGLVKTEMYVIDNSNFSGEEDHDHPRRGR